MEQLFLCGNYWPRGFCLQQFFKLKGHVAETTMKSLTSLGTPNSARGGLGLKSTRRLFKRPFERDAICLLKIPASERSTSGQRGHPRSSQCTTRGQGRPLRAGHPPQAADVLDGGRRRLLPPLLRGECGRGARGADLSNLDGPLLGRCAFG